MKLIFPITAKSPPNWGGFSPKIAGLESLEEHAILLLPFEHITLYHIIKQARARSRAGLFFCTQFKSNKKGQNSYVTYCM